MRIGKVPWLALLVVALLLIVALLPVFRITPENRTYIIGWDVDPPDQLATKSGEPTGFAVELVREAAKRRGIRLQWVEHPESSEAALRSKAVDLWPMMVITEDRKQILHLTDPYQEDQYGLLVDAKSAFTKADDLKQRTISYDGMPFNGRLLREHFPGAVHLRKSSLADAVRSVCVGEAQAVFDDRMAMFSLLLSSSPCPGISLPMLAIPTIKTRIGIGATRESRAAADAIREEIDVMAGDGSLGKIMSVWSYDSGQELDSLVVLQRAKSQLRWYRIGLAAIAALFLFASWAAAGYRQQRIKAQAYCRALGQAERNVRLVADSLSEMVVAYDMNRSLTYANSGAEKLTGYGLAELQVADFLSWTYPEDRPQVLALWDKVFGGQPVDQVDYRLIAKDGTVKWVTGAWGPVVEETGRQVGVRGTCRDITERVVAEQARQDAMQKFRTIVQEITERKRAEQALRESEERFRNMADTAPVMIWISGRDRLCTFFNKGWLDFTGRTLERELGNGWATGVHPDDLDRCFATYSSSFDACRTFQMEYRLRRADGEYRWVLCRGVPRFEPSGVFAGYIGSDTDITEQKRAAKELQSKFGQVQVLFELAGAVSRAQKPSEIYRAAVQGLVRAVGADRASVLIFDPHDVMRFEAWIGLSDEYRVAVEGHTPWRRGVRDAQPIAVADVMQDPSLSAYWQVFAQEGIRAVAFIPVLGNGGLIGKFMLYYNAPHEFQAEELQVAQTIATDVAFAAERQHAETALRDSEERFRATFFQAAVGIAQTNPDAKWLLLNDRFCEMLGYTPAELRGKTFLDFTHPDDREASLSAVRRLLADEISSWLTEKRYIRKDGAIVWVRLWVSLVRDQDKRPQYFISVVEDVTDRIEAERALRDSERRLALAQSGAHLGIWERDLRTNVKTISGEYAKLYGLPLDKRSLTYEE